MPEIRLPAIKFSRVEILAHLWTANFWFWPPNSSAPGCCSPRCITVGSAVEIFETVVGIVETGIAMLKVVLEISKTIVELLETVVPISRTVSKILSPQWTFFCWRFQAYLGCWRCCNHETAIEILATVVEILETVVEILFPQWIAHLSVGHCNSSS